MAGIELGMDAAIGLERELSSAIMLLTGAPPREELQADNILQKARTLRNTLMARDVLTIKEKWQGALQDGYHGPAAVFELWYKQRTNPDRVFRPLRIDTSLMLVCMIWTNTVLGGSRALDYFVPGMCFSDSDWNFYCVGSMKQYHNLISFFISLGGAWDNSYVRGSLQTGTYRTYYISINRQRVALSWVVDLHTSLTAIEVVNRLSPSILACYISGVNAVCVDPHMARQKLSVLRHPRQNQYTRQYMEGDMIQKYERRGVSFLPATEYLKRLNLITHPYYVGDETLNYTKPGDPTDYTSNTSLSSHHLLEVPFDRDILGTDYESLTGFIDAHDRLPFTKWTDERFPVCGGRTDMHLKYVRTKMLSSDHSKCWEDDIVPESMRFVDDSLVSYPDGPQDNTQLVVRHQQSSPETSSESDDDSYYSAKRRSVQVHPRR